jgi:hypothetical protein
MHKFKSYLTIQESVGQAGLDYELKVHNAMKDAKIVGLNAGDKPNNETAGFSNQGAGDIEASNLYSCQRDGSRRSRLVDGGR